MTVTQVDPSALQYGDPVFIDNARHVVKSIDGPDAHGTYDLYLTGECGDCHKVVSDAVAIVVNE